MPAIHIDKIQIPPTRQRREFEPASLLRLQESIERLGLMHPIVVRYEAENVWLVAGERRLRAIKEMWCLGGKLFYGDEMYDSGFVPIATMGELDPLEALDAELSENIIRQDLTWQERAEALAALQRLRLALNPDHRVADLAEEATGRRDGSYHDETRKQLLVARHLDNPKVAGAKDVKEAFKILRREEETKNFGLRAIEVGRTFGKHLHSALHGDCLAWLAEATPGTFDVICTDPPYGMGADSFGDGAGRLTAIEHSYGDTQDEFKRLLTATAPLLGRVAKPSAALYLCCDLDSFHWLRELFRGHGWYVFRTPLINVKSGSGRVPLPDQGPRRQYETILFAFRGGRKVNSIQSDVIITRGDEQLGHGAQKPVELFRDLLSRSCRPGDSVLDPFAGTGTIFPAAHALKCLATGIEQESAYYGMCVERIEELE